jgi:hypothetical protein
LLLGTELCNMEVFCFLSEVDSSTLRTNDAVIELPRPKQYFSGQKYTTNDPLVHP